MDGASQPVDASSTSSSGLNLLLCAVLDSSRSSEQLDSSNSDASVSPTPSRNASRRRSADEPGKDEVYWEKRRRNNDAAKRSREKRRLNDMRLLDLAKENSLLKSQLTARDPAIVRREDPPKVPALFPSSSLMSPIIASQHPFPALQLCHLQAAMQAHQVPLVSCNHGCRFQCRPLLSLGTGAFQPFQSNTQPPCQRASPDSSTSEKSPINYSTHGFHHNHHQTIILIASPDFYDGKHYLRYKLLEKQTEEQQRGRRWSDSASSAGDSSPPQQQVAQSLLGSLLSRRSPTVAQSRTEIDSGLSAPPSKPSELKHCLSSLAVNLSTKSDSDSLPSPVSSRGTDSTHSQPSPEANTPTNSAIVKALNARPDGSKQQYMDRRRRNNEAAKRCRANRRALFEYRLKRAQQLEQENGELKLEMHKLNRELEHLKQLIAAKTQS